MAKIEELIDEIGDARLRAEVAAEVRRIKSLKKFGLVFEEHLPETVRLPDFPIRVGGLVAERGKPGSDLWLVRTIKGSRVRCQLREREDGPQQCDFSPKDIVAVKRFGEAIYPSLVPIDRVGRGGPAKPWHVLINADNFHALQLLLYSYESQVDVIYIDPPYNTGARDWKYNNDYVDKADAWRHSKWLAMMKKRLELAKRLLKPEGIMVITIDDYEAHHLKTLINSGISGLSIAGTVVIKTSPSGRPTVRGFRVNHEYAIFVTVSQSAEIGTLPRSESQMALFKETDEKGQFMWANLRKRGGANTLRTARPKQFYPIYVSQSGIRVPKMNWDKVSRRWKITEGPTRDEETVYPIGDDGKERIWSLGHETLLQSISDIRIKRDKEGSIVIQRKVRLGDEGSQPSTFWDKTQYSIVENGTVLLEKILGVTQAFPFPKSVYAVADCLRIAGADREDALILDFFAGSGTTYHATALMNSEDGGSRRSILVTNNEVREEQARALKKEGIFEGDDEYEQHGIANSVTWPRCKFITEGKRDDGTILDGQHLDNRPFAKGFEENLEFFKLAFLDPGSVAMGQQFEAILPILWMKAGCNGKREASKGSTAWYIPKNSPFAVLIKEQKFAAFRKELKGRDDIKHIFLVTDSEENFRVMTRSLKSDFQTVQLYKSYLENFRINTMLLANS